MMWWCFELSVLTSLTLHDKELYCVSCYETLMTDIIQMETRISRDCRQGDPC